MITKSTARSLRKCLLNQFHQQPHHWPVWTYKIVEVECGIYIFQGNVHLFSCFLGVKMTLSASIYTLIWSVKPRWCHNNPYISQNNIVKFENMMLLFVLLLLLLLFFQFRHVLFWLKSCSWRACYRADSTSEFASFQINTIAFSAGQAKEVLTWKEPFTKSLMLKIICKCGAVKLARIQAILRITAQ